MRVEGYNFDIRKHVLEYDDVVNKQRETIYSQRRKILAGQHGELRDQIQRMITEQIQTACAEHLDDEPIDWNLEELHRAALTIYPVPAHITPDTMADYTDPDEIELMLVKGALEVYKQRIDAVHRRMDGAGRKVRHAQHRRSTLAAPPDRSGRAARRDRAGRATAGAIRWSNTSARASICGRRFKTRLRPRSCTIFTAWPRANSSAQRPRLILQRQ